MPDYRRWFQPGGTFFFTVNAYHRRPIFREKPARELLGNAIRAVKKKSHFEIIAICLLHDHLHTLWALPADDEDYSGRWKSIKNEFTTSWLAGGGTEWKVTPSQARRGHRGIWQRRFWEHLIRDENDLENHFDYIHYNLVKHGYVQRPWDWPYSSFQRYVVEGHYPKDWGQTEPPNVEGMNLD